MDYSLETCQVLLTVTYHRLLLNPIRFAVSGHHKLQKLHPLSGLGVLILCVEACQLSVIIGDTNMASTRSICRTQNLTQKLQLALREVRSISPERPEKRASRVRLLPSAMEEQIVEKDRVRISRTPSPEEIHPMELINPQPDTCQVSSPDRVVPMSHPHEVCKGHRGMKRALEWINDLPRRARRMFAKLSLLP